LASPKAECKRTASKGEVNSLHVFRTSTPHAHNPGRPEMAGESQAPREHKRDVVVLLDSITVSRAPTTPRHAAFRQSALGGIDANALQRPRRFFAAARNVKRVARSPSSPPPLIGHRQPQ